MGVRRKRWRWVACGPDPPSAETVHCVLRDLDHGVLGLTHSETGVGVLLVRVLREQLGDALSTLDLAGVPTMSTSGTVRTLRQRHALPSQRLAWHTFSETNESLETEGD